MRRYFVAIATAHYTDPGFSSLPVDTELAQLKAWLCDTERLGDRAFTVPDGLADLAHDPGEDQIRQTLRGPVKPWAPHDAAVVVVTGHGAMADGDHWTALRDSSSEDLPTTALRTADLVRWLAATGIENLLLVIDTCFAGAIVKQTFAGAVPVPESWLILPSVVEGGTVIPGGLTTAIGEAAGKLRGEEGQKYGTADRYFSPADFFDTVKSFLGPRQSLHQVFRGMLRKPHVCLPNPHYISPAAVLTHVARHELAPMQELATHWGPRARGVSAPDAPGWLFTGRAELMRELTWLVGAFPGTTLVTGAAGSGKSAVLARVVTLSDPGFLAAYPAEIADIPSDLRPRPKAVDVAVLASFKGSNEILGQLIEALDVPHPVTATWESALLEDGISAWTDLLSTREKPVTIVLDALDEAHNPRAVVDLLARLTLDQNANKVRLLIGVNSTGGPDDPLATLEAGYTRPLVDDAEIKLHARRLRIDDDLWWRQDDVRVYCASILCNTPGSPYAAPRYHNIADRIARAIAQRTGRSFLIARLTATDLAAHSGVIDPGDEPLLSAIDEDVARGIDSSRLIGQIGNSSTGHVFISYVREDSSTVDRLQHDLENAGIKVWRDRTSLDPGVRWKDKIRQAISAGGFFICCFSEASARRNRSYMNEEMTLAIDELRRRPRDQAWFLPIVFPGGAVPDDPIGAGETLQDFHRTPLSPSTWTEGISQLIKVIRGYQS